MENMTKIGQMGFTHNDESVGVLIYC
jgi:hypothetical protein